MRSSLRHHRRQNLATHWVLAILLFRAYVPLGFMPASGGPFLLEICPAGLSGHMVGQHLHHGTGNHAHFENCPFGSAPAVGPISHLVVFNAAEPIASQRVPPLVPLRLGVQTQRAHQARAPPALA
jgi:hypothetical protein